MGDPLSSRPPRGALPRSSAELKRCGTLCAQITTLLTILLRGIYREPQCSPRITTPLTTPTYSRRFKPACQVAKRVGDEIMCSRPTHE